MRRIQIEGDALKITTAMLRIDHVLSKFGNLIDEVRVLCREFHACQIRHVRRNANMTTHTLAKQAIDCREKLVWVEECPKCIRDIVSNDCIM